MTAAITIRIPAFDWRPRGYQCAAWRYLEFGGRHCELVWHRRSGKDELALQWTAVSMMKRPGNYWHMLPQANQARKALWDAINPHTGRKRIDEAFPVELRTKFNDHEMMLGMASSTWQVVGSDNFNSLLGSPPVGLVFSEWALCDPASWAYLSPIIEENAGWAIFNTTPRGRNHAYRSVQNAMATEGDFGEILPCVGTGVFDAKQLENIKAKLIATYGREFGLSIFEQEYLCSFDAANLGAILGRYVGEAEREGRVTDEVEYDPLGAPIEVSSDIGFRDTASWWFWQPRTDGFALVAHDSDSGLDAGDWIERLAQKVRALGAKLGLIWLPVDAKAKTFATRHSPMEQFLDAYGSEVIRVVPATKKLDQINAARSVIPFCHFAKTACAEGLDGLSAWSFAYDEELKDFSKDPVHDWASHHGDAFAYGALVMKEREIEMKKRSPSIRGIVMHYPGFGMKTGQTLEEMWAERPALQAERV